MTDERLAYLALTQVPGMGPARLQTLLTAFSTANGAHSAPFEFLCSLPGFSRAFASAIKETPLDTGRKILEAADRLGVGVFIPDDVDYPELLRHIPDPAPVLFALGDVTLLSRPAAAVVGSREHTGYGSEVCRRVVGPAASAGAVIVSGMARTLRSAAARSIRRNATSQSVVCTAPVPQSLPMYAAVGGRIRARSGGTRPRRAARA